MNRHKISILFLLLAFLIVSCTTAKIQNILSDCGEDHENYIYGTGLRVSTNRQKAKCDAFFDAERVALSRFPARHSIIMIGDSIIADTVSWSVEECPLFMDDISYEVDYEKTYFKQNKYWSYIRIKIPKRSVHGILQSTDTLSPDIREIILQQMEEMEENE